MIRRRKPSSVPVVIVQEHAITSACLTVGHLADHFSQLRRRADVMAQTFDASQRGYFTPTQDEQVRRLIVSYWQSRKALMELIQQVRGDERSPEDLLHMALRRQHFEPVAA